MPKNSRAFVAAVARRNTLNYKQRMARAKKLFNAYRKEDKLLRCNDEALSITFLVQDLSDIASSKELFDVYVHAVCKSLTRHAI